MRLEPVKYKRLDLESIGCFEAQMLDSGWGQTRYVNETKHTLLSVELSEFIRLVDQFFHDCADWDKLQKYVKKYGTNALNKNGVTVTAINFVGERMLYTFQLNGAFLTVYPYRKYTH